MVLSQLIDLKDDDYSTEVIKLARARSPNVDNWIITEQYMLEAMQEEIVTPEWLRNKSISKIVNEDFDLLGIRINKDLDVLLDQVEMVYLVLTLRQKLDPVNLYQLFKTHIELAEDVASCDGDYIDVIATWCRERNALDDGWEFIGTTMADNPDLIDSLPQMKQLIDEVVNKVYANGAPDVTVEAPEDLVVKLINLLAERQAKIRKIVDTIWCNSGNNDFATKSRTALVDRYFDSFEHQTGRRSVIAAHAYELASVDINDTAASSRILAALRKPFLVQWPHCIEHYLGDKMVKISDTLVAIMFATMFVDEPDRQNIRTNLEYKLKINEDQLGEGLQPILKMFNEFICKVPNDWSL